MGNPATGEIYEGNLRPGDVELSKEEADWLKEMEVQACLTELKSRFRVQDAAQAAAASGVSREMPRYKCHKEVWALKIAEIHPLKPTPTIAELEAVLDQTNDPQAVNIAADGIVSGAGPATIVPVDEGFAAFEVDAAYIQKHHPQVGGYFVVYKDGYKSYSPAQAFEEGYTRI